MPGTRGWQDYWHLGAFEGGRIIGLREAGWSNVVLLPMLIGMHKPLDVFGKSGSMKFLACAAVGVVPSDIRQPNLIGTSVDSSPQSTGSDIRRAVTAVIDIFITNQTVNRRLYEAHPCTTGNNYVDYQFIASHRRGRLAWYCSRANWGNEWNNVVFTDESRICLGACDWRVHLWRQPDPTFVPDRHTARQPGTMLWGINEYDSRSSLVREHWQLHYTLARFFSPFYCCTSETIFQNDNACINTARAST